MTAMFTFVNDFANPRVSSKRQRYSAVTAEQGRFCIRRVLTAPGLGAFAITTNVRLVGEERTVVWLEDSMRITFIGATPVGMCPLLGVENNNAG